MLKLTLSAALSVLAGVAFSLPASAGWIESSGGANYTQTTNFGYQTTFSGNQNNASNTASADSFALNETYVTRDAQGNPLTSGTRNNVGNSYANTGAYTSGALTTNQNVQQVTNVTGGNLWNGVSGTSVGVKPAFSIPAVPTYRPYGQ